jgi:hypothetical protein
MGLGIMKLPPSNAFMPDGSSNNKAARPFLEKSSGTPPSGAPNVWNIGFLMTDVTADEQILWQDKWPHDLVAGTVTVRIKGRMISATSSTVTLKAGQATSVDSSTDDSAIAFAAKNTNNGGATTVTGTAKQVFEIAIDLTGTNIAADRKFVIFIGRVIGGASGDYLFESADVEYAT